LKNKEKLNKKDILDKISNDDNLEWDITIEQQYIKATSFLDVTNNKKIIFKAVYYIDHPKSSRLNLIYDITMKLSNTKTKTKQEEIYDTFGGKKRQEARQVSLLIKKILSKNDKYKNIEIKIEEIGFLNVGDRVDVIKGDSFDGDDHGEKGTIVNEIDSKTNKPFYLVRFDNKFSPLLVDDDFTFDKIEDYEGTDCDCWPYRSFHLRKRDTY